MDWKSFKHWPKGFAAGLAVLFLLSLLSFDVNDPSLTNLRAFSGGSGNLLGLPGALLGGSLLELLGGVALLVPFLIFNWSLTRRNRPGLGAYLGFSAALLASLSGLHGLLAPHGDPGLADPGLAGWAVRRWVELTTGPGAGGLLLAFAAVFAANRLLYPPPLRSAFRDARVFAHWFAGGGAVGIVGAWRALRLETGRLRRVAGATALGWTGRTRRGLSDLGWELRRLPSVLLRRLTDWRLPSLASIKAQRAAAQRSWRPEEGALAAAILGGSSGASRANRASLEGNGFDAWFAPMEEAEELKEGAPPPSRMPRPGSGPGTDGPGAGAAGVGAAAPEFPGPRPAGGLAARVARADPPPVEPLAPRAPGPATALAPDLPAGAEDYPALPALPEDTGYAFEQPEAEAAWRERFQRYARNLDLDWQDPLWGREIGEPEEEPAPPGEEEEEEEGPEPL